MRHHVPVEAFEFYVSLGPARSYGKVAINYGVSLRGVTKAAGRERWTKRLEAIETKARETIDARLVSVSVAKRREHIKEIERLISFLEDKQWLKQAQRELTRVRKLLTERPRDRSASPPEE